MAQSFPDPSEHNAATGDDITSKVAECDRKLAQYRAILDAGANSGTVAAWIAETEAEKARRRATPSHRTQDRTTPAQDRSGDQRYRREVR